MFYTHSTEYCDTDQSDGSASLYYYSAVETKDSCCFCSFYCMYKYCTRLDKDSGIQIQITYIEECSSEVSASEEDIVGEPSVEMYIIVRKKSVYISSAYVLFVQVKHCDLRIIFEDHTGNDFIANLYRFSCCIYFNILPHCHDLTGSFMSKGYRDQVKWISLKFMCICTAHTASFNFNKDIIIPDRRNWIFFDVKMLFLC